MTRRIPIASITTSSPGVPGTFTIGAEPEAPAGDWRSVFQGKFFRQPTAPAYFLTPFQGPGVWTGTRSWWDRDNDTIPDPSPNDTPPPGYELITATVFDVVENATFAGRYTVFTKGTNSSMLESSEFSGGQTIIRVVEPVTGTGPDLIGTGYITNLSTYLLLIDGTTGVIVPPGTELDDFAVGLSGRNRAGWGEVNSQNHLSSAAHFAGASPPAGAFNGMLWYDTANSVMMVYDGGWSIVNSGAYVMNGAYRSTLQSSSPTWIINHGLGSAFPALSAASLGLVHLTVIVDTGGSVFKPIIPQDVTYDSADQLTVTFSAAYSGYALVRL